MGMGLWECCCDGRQETVETVQNMGYQNKKKFYIYISIYIYIYRYIDIGV